jgi:hypothetical protein
LSIGLSYECLRWHHLNIEMQPHRNLGHLQSCILSLQEEKKKIKILNLKKKKLLYALAFQRKECWVWFLKYGDFYVTKFKEKSVKEVIY